LEGNHLPEKFTQQPQDKTQGNAEQEHGGNRRIETQARPFNADVAW
jgi:hypothetical protein